MNARTLISKIRRSFTFNPLYYLVVWIGLDIAYIVFFFQFVNDIPITRFNFLLAHGFGLVIGTMVMFSGLGAGVLWIPLLTLLDIKPSEAVAISIFTQIAGKGIGSFNYFRKNMIDLKVARYMIPFAFAGVAIGYGAGFIISKKFERLLLYLFVVVAFILFIQMILSLNHENPDDTVVPDNALKKSRLVVLASSFFTGLLSIGNSDWLIPHMERHLNIQTSRAIATGLFIMFACTLFFLLLTALAVYTGYQSWPQHSSILFATCSGVFMGGQTGTRLVHIQWLKNHQKHVFIFMLGLSIIHLLW